MLSWLSIKNFALINSVEVEFDSGLNVLTGETGAGKSIVIGALQLLTGGRADKSLIRKGTDSCEVSGAFEIGARIELLTNINRLLEESGAPPCDEGQLLISRIITPANSRNFVNSTSVSGHLLRIIGDQLLDVHGPYDNQSLLKAGQQLAILDLYAGTQELVAKVTGQYDRFVGAKRKLEVLESEAASENDIDLIRFQIDEIDGAALQNGEDDELSARHRTIAHSQEILELVHRSIERFNKDAGIEDQIGDVVRDMQRLGEIDFDAGKSFLALMESIVADVQGAREALTDYLQSVDVDPHEFEQLEDRLALFHKLKRKYGGSLRSITEFRQDLEEKRRSFENFDEVIAELTEAVAVSKRELLNIAGELSTVRRRYANELGRAITEKLKELGFENASFAVNVGDVDVCATGIDDVEFSFAPNPGEGAQTLKKIASSGEISRVMLAIKTILAEADQIPLLVFDEIDVNIGGTVAVVVGKELRAVAEQHQVLCITHLPQVAAAGERHFVVEKSVNASRTLASISPLANADRVAEIARMLGGADSTTAVTNHASELIANAVK